MTVSSLVVSSVPATVIVMAVSVEMAIVRATPTPSTGGGQGNSANHASLATSAPRVIENVQVLLQRVLSARVVEPAQMDYLEMELVHVKSTTEAHPAPFHVPRTLLDSSAQNEVYVCKTQLPRESAYVAPETTVEPRAKSAPTTTMEPHAPPAIVASMEFVTMALLRTARASVRTDTRAPSATRSVMAALYPPAVATVAVA